MTESKKCTAAIIVAAGSSHRMGESVSKQFLEVKGVPVLVRTLQSFEACPEISRIVVVTKESFIPAVLEMAEVYGIQKLTAVVAGGDTRAASARCGFEAIGNDVTHVAIHDGARCLITPKEIAAVCLSAYRHGAATAAIPVTDTVKLATKDGVIATTLDRRRIHLAATPQIFDTELYRKALATGNTEATDDNQLVEALPHPVKLVECSRENIKITFPEDIPLAEFYLSRREGLS